MATNESVNPYSPEFYLDVLSGEIDEDSIFRDICEECHREIANSLDEAVHNTGECNCEEALGLCWKKWHAHEECRRFSIYSSYND